MKIIKHNKSLGTPAILLKGLISVLFFFYFNIHLVQAQKPTSRDYQLKSVFLFNFSQFVSWPSTAFDDTRSPFIIGIAGKDPFGEYIDETIKGEKVLNHPVFVERLNDLEDIKRCHILFINERDPAKIREILFQANNNSVLTVSDAENFIELGGMIFFKTINNKIKLHINVNAVKEVDLSISSKLLRVAELEN